MKRMFIGVKDGSAGSIKRRIQRLDNVTGISSTDTGLNVEYTGSHVPIAQVASTWEEVDSVQLGEPVRLFSQSTTYEPLDSFLWHYRKMGLDKKNAERLAAQGVVSHNPVKIAVIDSGYRPTHPDNPSNVNAFSKVTGESAVDTGSRSSHGTHVLTSIGAPINTKGLAGVVSNFGVNAEFYVYKFFPSGTAPQGDFMSALDDCMNSGVDVVNMSFGSFSYTETVDGSGFATGVPSSNSTVSSNTATASVLSSTWPASTYKHKFDLARNNGLIPVIASGNHYVVGSGGGRGTGMYDNGVYIPPQNTIATPAILSQVCPGVVSVGAANYNGGRSYFSQKGKGLKIGAYSGDSGVSPEETGFPNISLAGSTYNGVDSYIFMQGTSMATPMIVAAVAIIIATGVAGVNTCSSASDVDKILTKLYRGNSPSSMPSATSDFGHGIFNASWLV